MSLKYFLLATASLALVLPFHAMAETAAESPAAAAAAPASADKPATAPADKTVTAEKKAATSPADKTAAAPVTNPNAPVTHAEFEALLHETLLNNPEIVMEAVKKLHDKHMEESNKQMQESLSKHKEELANDTLSPSVGDAKTSDVTVIEFFDYHCGYCKHMLPVVTQLLNEDKKVHFIFREFPILSEDSVMASRAAIAVYNIDKEKYFDFHTALMKFSGKFDEKSIADIAKKVGVDPKKLKKEMANPEITDMLDKTRAIAEDLGIRGTPALIIGGELLPGAVPYDDMVKVIENARKGVKPESDAKSKAEAAPAKEPAKDESKEAPKPKEPASPAN